MELIVNWQVGMILIFLALPPSSLKSPTIFAHLANKFGYSGEHQLFEYVFGIFTHLVRWGLMSAVASHDQTSFKESAGAAPIMGG